MKGFKRHFTLIFFFGFLLFSLHFSCKKSTSINDRLEFKFYSLKNQGWKSKRVNQFINDINYTATEVPLEYYLLINNSNDFIKADSLYQINSKERIIEMQFQHVDEVDLLLEDYTRKSYEDAVKYMAFYMEKDFRVVTSSNDTISCSGVNFERNFKVAPFKRILLYFNNINPNDQIKLIYQDYLFGNGIIKFDFNETPLKL